MSRTGAGKEGAFGDLARGPLGLESCQPTDESLAAAMAAVVAERGYPGEFSIPPGTLPQAPESISCYSDACAQVEKVA